MFRSPGSDTPLSESRGSRSFQVLAGLKASDWLFTFESTSTSTIVDAPLTICRVQFPPRDVATRTRLVEVLA